MKTHLIAIVSFFTTACGLFAHPFNHKPVKELEDLRAEGAVFTAASRIKPLVLKSRKELSKYFDQEVSDTIYKAVDFKQQQVLVFAWKGSGQDNIRYKVKESLREQVEFFYERGRTKDLRPHVKVFVLSSNLKWVAR